MVQTGIVRDQRYLEHDTGPYHVESPQRLVYIYEALKGIKGGYVEIPPRPATHQEVTMVHDPRYVERIAATAGKGFYRLDPDTVASPRTYEVALLAAGGVLAAIDAVMEGLTNAFALVRPPGHHAERDRAMGFCIFNNCAIGACYALERYGMKRVLIIDWDLHHGNGTQHTFYGDPRVLYFSTHQYPFYPGTGHYSEIGKGGGRGFTVNCPLPRGCGDAEYANIMHQLLKPIAWQYRPELIIVSAGFDIHYQDPLGGMTVTEMGFARLTDIVIEVAEEVCGGRLVFTLEGGYNLEGEARAVTEVIKRMTGVTQLDRNTWEKQEEAAFSRIQGVITPVKRALGDHWDWEV